MAHIQKRGPGRWRARYRAPGGRERSRTFARRIDAERFLASVETRKATGEWIDPRLAHTTLADWVEAWKGTTVHLKPKTRAGYNSLLRTCVLPAFGDAPLGRIEPVHVKEWVAELIESGQSPSRVRQAYQLLSSILKAAVESGYLARSPCIGIRLPRLQAREMLFLSAAEVEHLAAVVEEPYGTLIYLLAYGGLRWDEAAALRGSRFDLRRSRIEVAESLAEVSGELHFGPTKTYQCRTMALPGFLRDMLAENLVAHVDDDADASCSPRPRAVR